MREAYMHVCQYAQPGTPRFNKFAGMRSQRNGPPQRRSISIAFQSRWPHCWPTSGAEGAVGVMRLTDTQLSAMHIGVPEAMPM
jgi:hypothetical protein